MRTGGRQKSGLESIGIPNPNDEWRSPKEQPNDKTGDYATNRCSPFGFRISFVIRHLSCLIHRLWSFCLPMSNPPAFRSIPRPPRSFVRPLIRRLHAYIPGEQPNIAGLIKLNTNENPFPPSPKVLRAVKAAADGRLRLYPNPTAQPLREKLARFHRCRPENITARSETPFH